METQIKNHVRMLVVVAVAALTLNVAFADDLNPPVYRGDPLSVYAHWQLGTTGTNDLVLNPANPAEYNWVDDSDPTTFLSSLLPSDIVTGPDYQFQLPNFIDKMPVKYMRLQLTWQTDPAVPPTPLTILGPSGEESGSPVAGNIVFSSAIIPVVADGSIVYQYHDIEFYPNPDWERWAIISPNEPLVQVVVDTVSTIPEPATLSMLAFGSLALFRKRK